MELKKKLNYNNKYIIVYDCIKLITIYIKKNQIMYTKNKPYRMDKIH